MRIAVAGGTGTVGKYVVQAAERDGHQAVVLSRQSGVDARSGEGLAAALENVDVIVDTTNPRTTGFAKASAFFTEVTQRLQALGSDHGASHLVTLSIVGVDRVPGFGYYRAKLAQEAAAKAGPLPATIVRATQFHEFPAQVLGRAHLGRLGIMARMWSQTVAARALGDVLAEIAAGPSGQAQVEVAGPRPAEMVDLARAVVRRRGSGMVVVPLRLPGRAGKAMRSGALLPAPGARIVGPTFDEWLEGDDLAAVG